MRNYEKYSKKNLKKTRPLLTYECASSLASYETAAGLVKSIFIKPCIGPCIQLVGPDQVQPTLMQVLKSIDDLDVVDSVPSVGCLLYR